MGQIKIIRALLDADPGTYAALTNKQVADLMNLKDIPVVRDSIPGNELFSYTDETEYLALSSAQKTEWLSLCAIDTVFRDAVAIIKSIFPNGTATWAAIKKTELTSIALQNGLSEVKEGHVEMARALP